MISAHPTAEELAKVKAIADAAPNGEITYLVNRAAKGWAIAGFFNRTTADVEIAVYGEGNWATKSFLTSCFWYVFKQLNCVRCTAQVAASNVRAYRMNTRLGFQLEGIQRKGLGDEDILLLGMLRNECRWLPVGEKTNVTRQKITQGTRRA